MRRREFIAFVGSTAIAWPLTARAQQHDRMRRIGVLMALAADDPAGQARFVAFVQALQELGWTDGRNVQIDTRWAAGDAERFRRYAAELVALAPDVILASGGTGVGALLQASRTRGKTEMLEKVLERLETTESTTLALKSEVGGKI